MIPIYLPPAPLVTMALHEGKRERASRAAGPLLLRLPDRLGGRDDLGPVERAFEALYGFVVQQAWTVRSARDLSPVVDQVLGSETYALLLGALRVALAQAPKAPALPVPLALHGAGVLGPSPIEAGTVWSWQGLVPGGTPSVVSKVRRLDELFALLGLAEAQLLATRAPAGGAGGGAEDGAPPRTRRADRAFLAGTLTVAGTLLPGARRPPVEGAEVPAVEGARLSLLALDPYAILAHAALTGPLPIALFSSIFWRIERHADAALGLLQSFDGIELPAGLRPPAPFCLPALVPGAPSAGPPPRRGRPALHPRRPLRVLRRD